MMPLQLIKAHAEWGIPSFDPASLEAELFVLIAAQRMQSASSSAPLHTVLVSPYSSSPASASGSLPVAIYKNAVYPSETIIDDLNSNWHNLDSPLTVAERNEVAAYRTSSTSKLSTALLFLEYQSDAPSPYAAGVESFLARKRLQWARHAAVKDRLRSERVLTLETATGNAIDAFHALAVRLGNNPYFFGATVDKISTLDVTAAAYVTVAAFGYASDMNPLAAVLRQFYPSLLAHAHRVLTHSNISNYTATSDFSIMTRSNVERSVRNILLDSYAMPLPPDAAAAAAAAAAATADPDSIDDDVDSARQTAASAAPAAADGSASLPVPYKDAALEWARARIAEASPALCEHAHAGDVDAETAAAAAGAKRQQWWPVAGTYAAVFMVAYVAIVRSFRK